LNLFCDFALPKLTSSIIDNVLKRYGIIRILQSFAAHNPHARIQCIKVTYSIDSRGGLSHSFLLQRLQRVVPPLSEFIHCLSVIAMDEESTIDDRLLDLYIYYATMAFGQPAPRLRSTTYGNKFESTAWTYFDRLPVLYTDPLSWLLLLRLLTSNSYPSHRLYVGINLSPHPLYLNSDNYSSLITLLSPELVRLRCSLNSQQGLST
jgi:hypothetical protein